MEDTRPIRPAATNYELFSYGLGTDDELPCELCEEMGRLKYSLIREGCHMTISICKRCFIAVGEYTAIEID